MIVLGIDPGPTESGFVLLDSTQRKVIGSGVVQSEGFLGELRSGAFSSATPHIAIEWITSYGMAVGASVFETCRMVGRMQEALQRNGVQAQLLPRASVKLALCGSARAKDANVRQALLDLIGPAGTKKERGPTYGVKSHAWAALAVAAVHAGLRPA